MEFFSRVVINATDDIYPEEFLDTSIRAECFDFYIRRQEVGEKFYFRPEVYVGCLDEFRDYLCKVTGIRISDVGYSDGFLEVLYPPGYSESIKVSYNYLFHQLMRIPAVLEDVSGEGTSSNLSFQGALDRTNEVNSYWGFEVKFDWKDFVNCIRPLYFDIKEKQTKALLQVISPFACEYCGYFLSGDPLLDTGHIKLILDVSPHLLPKVRGISAEPVFVNNIKEFAYKAFVRSKRNYGNSY